VRFSLGERDLSHVNPDGQRLVGAGRYSVSVSGGQPGTGAPVATAEFEIRGETPLPRRRGRGGSSVGGEHPGRPPRPSTPWQNHPMSHGRDSWA
jgi:hypothetical protein